MEKEHHLGLLGRQVAELAENMINHSYENSLQAIKSSIAQQQEKQPAIIPVKKNKAAQGVKMAASAALPAAFCMIGISLAAPAAAIGAVTLAGGIGSVLLMRDTERAENYNKSFELDEVIFKSVRENSYKELRSLLNYVASYEADVAEGYDITTDRQFGEWLQKFLIFAAQSEDRKIGRMYDDLITKLAAMKITVYDELVLNDNGEPDIPCLEYFVDKREDGAYHKVTKPAIYTKRGILARGEII